MTTYRRRKVEQNPERQILLGMIVSDKFIRDIQPILKIDLIETPFILTAIGWCQEYYKQFQTAPGLHIEDIYKKQVKLGNLEDDQEQLIADLLLSLNAEYERAEQFNSAYFLDQAEKHFESRNLANRIAGIKQSLSRGDVAAAQKEILEYKRVSLPQSNGIDPFTDREGMRLAFESAGQPLFRLPGAAGKFLNDLFVRDGFVTLLGPEKRGKTWMLIELSFWARKAGLNVAFFSAGDMSTPQLQLRYGIRFTGRSHKPRYCGELKVPVLDCWHNQDDSCDCTHRAGIWGIVKDKEKKELLSYEEAKDHVVCTHCLKNKEEGYTFQGSSWFAIRSPVTPLVWTDAIKAGEKLNRRWGKKSKMRLASYANFTLTMDEIRHQLNLWEDEDGFIPDVTIVDYMDLIVPNQDRMAINQAWASMRGLSQERHCLVLSASQSDAESQYIKWIGYKNFSEDKRKFAHVTGMITLNQTMEEKARKIMRLGQLAIREDDSDQKNYVTILQSLAQGRAIVDSF